MSCDPGPVGVQVDDENPARLWWEHLRAEAPMLAQALAVDGHALVSESVYRDMEALPGWLDGPAYAPRPLMGCDPVEVMAGPHRYFETFR